MPLYGQADAGAIWNRTVNKFFTDPTPDGLGLERSTHDPCVYSKEVGPDERVSGPLYVDDGRLYCDPTPKAREESKRIREDLTEKFDIEWGEVNPEEDQFLGGNRISHTPHVATTKCYSYIRKRLVKDYLGGDVSITKERPASWGQLPADDATLMKAWESAMVTRTPASPELTKRYMSAYGAGLHAVKFRPEIAAVMSLLGACLTFPTEELYQCLLRVLVYLGRNDQLGVTFSKHAPNAKELVCYADSNWSTMRSTTGYVIFLAGGAVSSVSRRQHLLRLH